VLVPALNGPERKLAEVLYPIYDLNYHSAPAWSPDSKHLVVTPRSIPTRPGGLFLVSVETGGKRKLIDPPTSSIADIGPAFSPDGRALVFNRSLSYQHGDLYRVDLSGDLQPTGAATAHLRQPPHQQPGLDPRRPHLSICPNG
jgi:hypothetical protein